MVVELQLDMKLSGIIGLTIEISQIRKKIMKIIIKLITLHIDIGTDREEGQEE